MNGVRVPPPTLSLGVFVGLIVIQRLTELGLSARHARRLRRHGAHEYGAAHMPLLVLVHVLYPLALIGEVLWLGALPDDAWPLWLGLWCAAQLLRYSAIRALGEYWTVRILAMPRMRLVRSGPYRWMRHPNYVAVVLELFAGPMMFGAWRSALAISALNAIALAVRIHAEEDVLESAGFRPPRSITPDHQRAEVERHMRWG